MQNSPTDLDAKLREAEATLKTTQLVAEKERATWREAREACAMNVRNDQLWHTYVDTCRTYADAADALATAKAAFEDVAMEVLARDLAEPVPEIAEILGDE